jgi:PAS domain-containing protein
MTLEELPAGGLSHDAAFFGLLTLSHRRLVGTPLVPEGRDARWLYEEAPFAVVAHDTGADPRFVYANRTAQACFEYDLDVFVGLPSRLSAEAEERAARQKLLDEVARKGFIADYRGVRIARSGRRFWIENAVVWQLIDAEGVYRGQAAAFSSWRDIA